MTIHLHYPPIHIEQGKDASSLQPVLAYLHQTIEDLNIGLQDVNATGIMTEIVKAIGTDGEQAEAAGENPSVLANYDAIKDMLIKTGDYAFQKSDTVRLALAGQYVSIGDFGTYFENATVNIEGTPYGITQLYNYSASIDSVYGAYKKDVESYIKTGLLYYDQGDPIYGVAVGNLYNDTVTYALTTDTTVNAAKTYYALVNDEYEVVAPTENDNPAENGWYETMIARSGNLYANFTADEIAFWYGGTKRASITSTNVYFPYAEGVFGPWTIGATSIWYDSNVFGGSGMYFGTEGLSLGNAFKVTANGKLTAVSASLTTATISGTLTAGANSKIGPWNVSNNALWYGTSNYGSNGGIYIGTSGLSLGSAFQVTPAGGVTANNMQIAGNSTFSGMLDGASGSFSGSLTTANFLSGTITANSVSVDGSFYIYNNTIYYGRMGYGIGATTSGNTYGVKLEGQTSLYYLIVTGSGVRMQANNNYFYLSEAQTRSYRSVTIDSDRRRKESIDYDMSRYKDFFLSLRPCSFKLKAIEEDVRHIGFIAQDVRDSLVQNGIDRSLFAPLNGNEDDGYSLAYGEWAALNTYMIQVLYQRIEDLEQQIQQIK